MNYAKQITNAPAHIPVMLAEVLKYLQPAKGKSYIDATLGAGGHTLALLQAGAKVVGIDRDQAVIALAESRIAEAGLADHFESQHGSFADVLSDNTLPSNFDGVLFDLGVSSIQLDTPERGFSFRFEAPLDMRMDPDNQQVTARDLVNGLGRKELYALFTELGEERFARQLADAICQSRKITPFTTTTQLSRLIETLVPRQGHLHPATKVFQALRMAVNTERDELKAALPSALSHLAPGGVLIVISFHSLEDRLVKSQFADWVAAGQASLLTSSPLTPSEAELQLNKRAHSAKLRAARKEV